MMARLVNITFFKKKKKTGFISTNIFTHLIENVIGSSYNNTNLKELCSCCFLFKAIFFIDLRVNKLEIKSIKYLDMSCLPCGLFADGI